MPDRLTPNSLLSKLDTQPRVRDFLARAVTSGRASHAYLFLGSPGSGKLVADWAVAQALLCGEDGVSGACASCDDCGRVARRTHPDVHYFAPESATGYLIAQTRELLEDVALAPIRAKAKVYIVDRAEQLRANTANALLKTLEEPPAGVTFILLGSSADVMLPVPMSCCPRSCRAASACRSARSRSKTPPRPSSTLPACSRANVVWPSRLQAVPPARSSSSRVATAR